MPRVDRAGVATLLALTAGIAGAVQVATLGRLGSRIGELEAAAVAFALTAIAGLVILLLVRRSLSGYREALTTPWWMWLGGLMGVVIVTSIIIAGPRIGVLATSTLLITGQLFAGTAVDRFGWFGVTPVAIGWQRLVGLGLLLAGAILVVRR